MFENPRAWSTLCDCIDIASKTIRAIADPSYNMNQMAYPSIPHASRRDVGYQNMYPNQMCGGNVYPTHYQPYPQYQPPQYQNPQPYGMYATPFIPGKCDPNYGMGTRPTGHYQTYAPYFNPPPYQGPNNNQTVTCSFGHGGRPIKQNLGGYYGY